MTKRPYPPGTAWDEAWYERQRADALEEAATAVIRAAAIGDQNFITCLQWQDEPTKRLRLAIANLADLLRGECE
jgi:hypothetical protein